MPWKVRKRKCRQRDGDKGKYVVVKVKRGGGTKQSSCHTTKNLAKRATRARYASAYGESVMKITAGQLRQIIKEELGSLNEQHIPQDMLERLNSVMISIAERVVDGDLDEEEVVGMFREIVIGNAEGFIKETLLPMHRNRAVTIDDYETAIQQAVDTLANEEVFRDASAEDVAMQSLDYVDHPPSLADEAYEIALAAAVNMGIPRKGR